jgi:alpha-ribazole phosphatase
MRIYLLRHGETAYNAEKRYQGTRDIPLSDAGRAKLARADFSPRQVVTSPLCRAVETARVLFPDAALKVEHDLREMCFGVFEGKTYREMEGDPDFLACVGADRSGRCPGGESRGEFSLRTCAAFERLMEQALSAGEELLVIMAHGDTQMALMERYALPHRPYDDWCGANGGGYVLETDKTRWDARTMTLVETVQYTKQEKDGECE